MLQSKESDQFEIRCLTHVVVVVSGFRCECFLQIIRKRTHERLGNQGFAPAIFIKPVTHCCAKICVSLNIVREEEMLSVKLTLQGKLVVRIVVSVFSLSP